MTIVLNPAYGAGEQQALAELEQQGFTGAVKDYPPGTTEPHRHDYDILLYILDGEFRLGDVKAATVHSCMPGDKVFVSAGTPHFEDHGMLRMVVGRRQ